MEPRAYQLHQSGVKPIRIKHRFPPFLSGTFIRSIMSRVKAIGLNRTMEEYDQRKLSIFNQLNFFQFLAGVFIAVVGLISSSHIPFSAWVIASLPALVSLLVLYLNKVYRHEAALIVYFLLYPFVTCVIYLSGINLGISLFFIFYGILSVFFLKDIGYIIFSLLFSMVSYFILSVVLKHYWYNLEDLNHELYLFNHLIALGFIFYGLFLIKRENTGYHNNILSTNFMLRNKNEQIITQAERLKENAALMKKQAQDMAEVNSLKNKLFSVISHDLKAPLYALRNLFNDVHQRKTSAEELQQMMPEVVNDLNYTVGLMENLLQWSKAQMQSDEVHPQEVELDRSIHEVLQILHLQAKAKNITIQNGSGEGLIAFADKNMINLVLRNLVSNAIKFTPDNGTISIGVHEHDSFLEIYVQDNGRGISGDVLRKINSHQFYTSKGTASESGTGLGLMLCKEFLARNGGHLHIESELDKGSTFSFTVPKAA